MNTQKLIKKYKKLEGVWNAPGAETARQIFLQDLEQLDEPKKVAIPQFVADWIEYCQKHDFTLFGCLDPENGFESLVNETFEGDVRKCIRWCRRESNIFARAWLDGYEVEKQKRYLVKVKGVNEYGCYLNKGLLSKEYFLESKAEIGGCITKHTRKELEEAGFGWVFDCDGIEIVEVE